MLGPAARMAASTGGDEEEKTAQAAPAVAKAGRRAGRERATPTAASGKATGNFMSSPRNQLQADSSAADGVGGGDDNTLLKPSRRAPPPSSGDDDSSPPLSPTSPAQKTRGRAGDSLASEAEAAMGMDEASPRPLPKTAGWGNSPAAAAAASSSSTVTVTAEDNVRTSAQSPSATQPSQQPAFGRRNAAAAGGLATVGAGGSGAKAGGLSERGGGKHDVTDEITDITEIPDLEDEGKQDITLTVAATTHARSHTVQALNELDRQLEGRGGMGGGMGGEGGVPALLLNGGEVDVSLLLGVLCGVAGVDEGEAVWEFDALFSEVSSDMYAEMEHQDAEDGGEEADATNAAVEKVKATAQTAGSKRTSLTAK